MSSRDIFLLTPEIYSPHVLNRNMLYLNTEGGICNSIFSLEMQSTEWTAQW